MFGEWSRTVLISTLVTKDLEGYLFERGRLGDEETWGLGDEETWGLGDEETWGLGDEETWGLGDCPRHAANWRVGGLGGLETANCQLPTAN